MDPGILLSGALQTVLNGAKKVKKRTLTLSSGRLDGYRDKKDRKLTLQRQNSAVGQIELEFTFDLAKCFNINRQEHPKFTNSIAIFMPAHTLVLGWEDAGSDKEKETQNNKEFDAWYCSLTDEIQKSSLAPDSFGLGDGAEELMAAAMPGLLRSFYEYCWDVEVLKKCDICVGKAPQLAGPRRLCITNEGITLIRKGAGTITNAPPDSYTFSIIVIKHYGFQGAVFSLTVGRQSPTGTGEILIETEDPIVAKSVHGVIATIIERRREDRSASFSSDTKPRIRTGTGSATDSIRPIARDRSNTEIHPTLESIHKRLHSSSTGSSTVLDHPGSIGAGVNLAALLPSFGGGGPSSVLSYQQKLRGETRRTRTLSSDHDPEWSSPTLMRKSFLHNRCVSVNPSPAQLSAARKFSAGPILHSAGSFPSASGAASSASCQVGWTSIKNKLQQSQQHLLHSGRSSDSLPAGGYSGGSRGSIGIGQSAFGWMPNSQSPLASSPTSRSSDSLHGSDSSRSQRGTHSYPRTPSQEVMPAVGPPILEEGAASEYLPMQAGSIVDEGEGGSGDTIILPIRSSSPREDYTSMGGTQSSDPLPTRSISSNTTDSAYTEMSSPRTATGTATSSVISPGSEKEPMEYTKMGPAPAGSVTAAGSSARSQHSRQASYNMEEVTVTHLSDAGDSDSCYSSCAGGASVPQTRAYSVGSRPQDPPNIMGIDRLPSMDSGVHEQNRPPSAGSVSLGGSAATYNQQAHVISHLNTNLHPAAVTRLHLHEAPEVDNRKRAYSVGSKLFGVPFRKLSHGAKYPLAMAEEVTNRLRSGSFGSSSGRGTPHGRMSQELTKATSSDGGPSEDLMEMNFGPSPPIGRSPSGSIGSCESLTRSRTGSTGAKGKDVRGIPITSKYTHPPPSNLLRSPSSSFHPENCTIREVESPTQKLEKEITSSNFSAEGDYLAMGADTPKKTSAEENQTPKLIQSRSGASIQRGADEVESRVELERRLAELALCDGNTGKTAIHNENESPDYINFCAQPTELEKPTEKATPEDYAPMSAQKPAEADLYAPMVPGKVEPDAPLYEAMEVSVSSKVQSKPKTTTVPLTVSIPKEADIQKISKDVRRKTSRETRSPLATSPNFISESVSPTSPRLRVRSEVTSPHPRTSSFTVALKSPKAKSSFAKFFSPIIGKIHKNTGSSQNSLDAPKQISSRSGSHSNSNSASSWVPAESVVTRQKASSVSGRRPESESSACSMHLAEPNTSLRDRQSSHDRLEMDVVQSYLMDDSDSSQPPSPPAQEPQDSKPEISPKNQAEVESSRPQGNFLLPAIAARRDVSGIRKYSEPATSGRKNLSPSEKLLREENMGNPSHIGISGNESSKTHNISDSRIRSSSGSARLATGTSLEYATLDLPENSGGDRSPSPQIHPSGKQPHFDKVGSPQRYMSDSTAYNSPPNQTVYTSIDPRKSEGLKKSSRNS